MTDLKDLKELAEAAISISPRTVLELIVRVEELEAENEELGRDDHATVLLANRRQFEELKQAKAREAELRSALERFADVARLDIGADESDDDLFKPMSPEYARAFPLTVGMFRNAVTAMGGDDG